MHELIALLMTIAENETVKKTPAQARFGWRFHRPIRVWGGSRKGREKGGRGGGGSRYDFGADRDPSCDRAGPGRACRGKGTATARSGPGPCRAWRGDCRRAGATGIPAVPPNRALFPRGLVLSLPDPSLHPAAQLFTPTSSPEDGSPRTGVHSDGHRAPERPGPPGVQAALATQRAGGRRQAWPAALQCPAEGAAHSRRRPPRPLPTARCTSGLSGGVGSLRPRRSPAPVPDHSFQRSARDAPPVTLGLASLVPSERAGTAP